MNLDRDLINQIVANVLQQLQSRAETVRPVEPVESPVKHGTVFSEQVITAELLEGRLNGAARIQIGPKSILTPSAHDLLRSRKVEWSRDGVTAPSASAGGFRWLAVVASAGPVVQSVIGELKRSGGGWKHELVGLPREAAELSAGAISKAEADGVIVFTDQPEQVACLANRNRKVRAAAVQDVLAVDRVREQLGANLLCVSPQGRTFTELRNIVRRFTVARPQAPAKWDE